MRRWILLAAVGVAISAHAEDKAKAKSGKVPKLDLNMPTLGAVPKGEELQKPKESKTATEPTVIATNASWTVTKVTHGRQFMRAAGGATPVGGALEAIPVAGTPPTSERFTTVIRVKCPQRANAEIDLAIMDGRGNSAMTSRGELNYRAVKQDEIEYTVEWDPTPMAPGAYQLMIKVDGNPLGTWPMAFGASAPPAKK